jgi:CheY-like chemotaxis protein
VTSGLQALEQLRDGFHPDLILLDIMMERIDGVTFLSHLREMPLGDAIPVIAMSTATVLERYGSQLRVNGTLIKPITQAALAEVLQPFCPPDPDQDAS